MPSQKILIRISLYLILLMAVVSIPAKAQNQLPRFEAADCMFTLPLGAEAGLDVECGYLIVPEQHAQPEGPTLKLAVAILKSRSRTPAPDPFVMAQGGPGGSTIEFASAMIDSPLLNERDIILFDQRGTLHSEPNLLCPELITFTQQIIEKDLELTELFRLQTAVIQECHERLTSEEGINLAAFNSVESAADVEALRVALGYDQINFYGVSYGTLLAFHVMRDHPHGLRSVVLDAVVPPQINFITEVPRSTDRAFSEFFAACAADSACSISYPDLEQRFFSLVEKMNQTPIRVPVTDPETGITYQAVLDGDGLVDLLFQFLYPSEFIPLLPKMIADIPEGDYSLISFLWPLLLFDRTFSMGMYQSVICAEDADFTVSDLATENVRPPLTTSIEVEYETFLESCQQWQVPYLGPKLDEPVVSDIPTLLLSGRFDPVTPPYFAEAATRTLSHSYHFVFPNNGHGAINADCPDRIIQSFLENPQQEPEAYCLKGLSPTFYTPENTLMISVVGSLLNLSLSSWIQFGILGLCVLGLLTAWIFWPLLLILGVMGKIRWPQSRPKNPLLRHFSWTTLPMGCLTSIFLIALLGAVIWTVFNAEETILLIGLPWDTAPIFLLPPLIALWAVMLLGVTLIFWRNRNWTVWERVYYAFLTLMALLYVAILGWWDMLMVFL